MTTVIRFDSVSKKYRLGLTRTSVPGIISRQVGKAFGSNSGDADQKYLWALSDLSFELKQGESLALIGRNGSGKTTTLKLLANITQPTSGRIETRGKLSALIELGAGFHPDLTGRENIYLNGTILGLRRQHIVQRFDEIVAFSELEDFLDTPIKRYSSGMKVRLGFAVAACIEPDILLVDEVLAVGDAAFRQKCMDRIRLLLDRGTAIIFVSHNLWLAQAICESAIYLEKGQALFSGEISRAIALYDRALSEQRAREFDLVATEAVEVGDDVEITKVEVKNGSDPFVDATFSHDQPTEVHVYYLAYRSLGPVNVVVRLVRSDGLTCCMMRSSLDGAEVTVERGHGVVSLILDPLQLRGGTYFAQAMIRDGADAAGLTTKNSDWFYVGGSVLSHNDMNGVFEPNRAWSQQHLAENGRLPPEEPKTRTEED
jgi:lipopolysaccharide transport system ATP-binding protein